jgi:TPR repeat protein
LWIGATALAICSALPAQADFESGLKAYNSGNKTQAFLDWKVEADGGDAVAQWLVGNMYAKGEGMDTPNPARAARYYIDAAEQGYSEAQVSLGTLYRLGYGVPQDYKTALAWLYEAAAKKHPVAQVDLGDLFLKGIPGQIERNGAQALQWYLLAARDDVIVAQFKAGQIYLENAGVEPDVEAGLAWMHLAYRAAAAEEETTLSRRVLPLDQVVETDKGKHMLRDLIIRTYAEYRKRYPTRIVERSERMAREGSAGIK